MRGVRGVEVHLLCAEPTKPTQEAAMFSCLPFCHIVADVLCNVNEKLSCAGVGIASPRRHLICCHPVVPEWFIHVLKFGDVKKSQGKIGVVSMFARPERASAMAMTCSYSILESALI